MKLYKVYRLRHLDTKPYSSTFLKKLKQRILIFEIGIALIITVNNWFENLPKE